MSELLYGNKPMDPKPINGSLESVCRCLRRGETVVVKLEPGDATHYCLLIVPAWAEDVAAHLGRYGIREHSAVEYLIVTQLDDAGGQAFYAFAHGMEGCDMRHIRNSWTQQIFTWWFDLLWTKLRFPETPLNDEADQREVLSPEQEHAELEARREDQAYDDHVSRESEPA